MSTAIKVIPMSQAEETMLDIDQNGLKLWYRIWGNQSHGVPVLFVHGGPGNCVADYEGINEKFFDKDSFFVVEVDQRGTGNSQPSVRDDFKNMQKYLDISISKMSADFEMVREKLGIERWLVFGGSWGSTLGLHYAQTYPSRCLGLILRGIFLNMKEEFDAVYAQKSFENNPHRLKEFKIFFEIAAEEAIKRGESPLDPNDSERFVRLYESMIVNGNRDAMWRFHVFENNLVEEDPTELLDPYVISEEILPMAASVSFFESRLFLRGTFEEPLNLLDDVKLLKKGPVRTWIVQGTGDEVCPDKFARELVEKLKAEGIPHTSYFVDAGHKASSNGVFIALQECVKDFLSMFPKKTEQPKEAKKKDEVAKEEMKKEETDKKERPVAMHASKGDEEKEDEDIFLFTSESVNEGHPDKLCDQVSDAILDACLKEDAHSKVACETCTKTEMVMVFGEITTKANVNYEQVVRDTLRKIGYDDNAKGIDYRTCSVVVAIEQQSPDIAQGVHLNKSVEEIGAGDQGHMFGYATDETNEMMPLTHLLATCLGERLTHVRKEGICKWVRPDGKTQVVIAYKCVNGAMVPQYIHTIVISTQHDDGVSNDTIRKDLMEHVIKPTVDEKYLTDKTIYHLNPSGRFVIGGPHGDAGLTGRKIIIDTYGGWGAHGGGAFSGKDPTKVDRSAAYFARWIAKSLVAAKLCKRALVQLSYAIGVAEPLSVHVDTYGTGTKSDFQLAKIIRANFDCRPGCIIRDLQLLRPIYQGLACYGHFGRDNPDYLWETVKELKVE